MEDDSYIINHSAQEYYKENITRAHIKIGQLFKEGRWKLLDEIDYNVELPCILKDIYNEVSF